jgi:hypothetical protein
MRVRFENARDAGHIVCGNDRNKYPISVALRGGGYTNVADVDSWGTPWQLSPSLLSGQASGTSDDVHLHKKGAGATGVYLVPFASDTGLSGSVGYSSVYGSWTGK